MKSKVSPLALGGVLALCAAILGFAFWMLAPGNSPQVSDASLESSASSSIPSNRVDPAHPPTQAGASAAELERARVALADDTHPVAAPQVEFELRSSSEKPLSNACTVLHRGELVIGAQKCDAAGVVHFDAGDGRAELIVVAKDVPAFARDVSIAVGHQVIALERGAAVSGRVRVAAEGSVAGVKLVLTSDRPLIDDSNWPATVRHALELNDSAKLELVTHTNESGQFEFSSLASPWSGKLEVGDTHELTAVSGGVWTQGSDSIRLDDPIDGLVLDLAAFELARGRVVTSAGGPGVAHASINGQLTFEPALDGEGRGATADFDGEALGDGSFALPIHRRNGFDTNDKSGTVAWPALKNAMLTLDGGHDLPRRRLELNGAQLPEGFDFGELVLERGATLAFVVSDAQAKPLAGAIARIDGERSEATDENGRSTIVYAPGTRRPLTVSLDGYRDARVEIPKEQADALKVVLERTNRLTIVVKNPDGLPVVGVSVQIAGQRPTQQRGRGRNRVNEQRTNDKGRAEFSDLTPDVPLPITVRDAMGASVAERTATLGADEWSTLEISIPRALLSFSGVVRDELGLSLAEAAIEFTDTQSANRGNISAESDADGRFEFSGLSTPVGKLRVRKSGFAPLSIPEFQIPPPGVIADIRLDRGLRLTLRIVDSRGAPVRGENLRLESPGERPVPGRRTSDNEWDFANLPRFAMTAVGNVGNREYRQDLEPLNGNQDFVVPVQGGLEVSLRLDPALLQSPLRIALRARDDRRVALTQALADEVFQTKIFAPVLPGDYQLSVMQFQKDDQRGNWVNLGAVQRVKITEGATQRLELAR